MTRRSEHTLSVVLAGGGSAGHVSPLLAVAAALQQQQPQVRILVMGTSEGLETRLVPEAGLPLQTIDKVPFPRQLDRTVVTFPRRLRRVLSQTHDMLDKFAADVVLGVGGYVCAPLYLAAHKRKVPIVIHEANMRVGLANRLGSRYAHAVGTAFETKFGHGSEKIQRVGMPMSADIVALGALDAQRRASAKRSARMALGLDPDRPLLVAMGGSLGAARINRAVGEVVKDGRLLRGGLQILHATGAKKAVVNDDGAKCSAVGYHQREYFHHMAQVYAAADVILCRAGAGTVCELAVTGVPSVLVPLPVGNGEQRENATSLVRHGGAVTVEDGRLTSTWLEQEILPLIHNRSRLEAMGQAARTEGMPHAAERMAQIIIESAKGVRP